MFPGWQFLMQGGFASMVMCIDCKYYQSDAASLRLGACLQSEPWDGRKEQFARDEHICEKFDYHGGKRLRSLKDLKKFKETGNSPVWAADPVDIGQCRRVKVRCLSETSWFDGAQLLSDIKHAGGTSANHYTIPWSFKNSGGYSALVEVEALDGTARRFLLDTGWNPAWMEYCFQREGIDDLLRKNEIDFLFISHEHMDHFWGLPVVLKYRPDIKIIISNCYYSEGKELIQKSGHTGQLVELPPGNIHPLFPGCAAATFDISIFLRVQGEHVLFFNVKDKGMVTVTGCCHMGVVNLLNFCQGNIQGSPKPYGLYGGLHISPFEQWDAKLDSLISEMAAMNLQKVAANHCTGLVAIEKMIASNIPVVRGTAKYGSKSELYVGNGDEVIF
jgi:7,8-dihydropterin-6-yl-methyl-4-(beta-D-ribofuranosyl)aminobenzene 5'-phosphate synthase